MKMERSPGFFVGAGERATRKGHSGQEDDRKDSAWLAELLQHGLLKSSFAPPEPIRELRDLTR